jgi:hypothetical protein
VSGVEEVARLILRDEFCRRTRERPRNDQEK